jgi:hypothetical protein
MAACQCSQLCQDGEVLLLPSLPSHNGGPWSPTPNQTTVRTIAHALRKTCHTVVFKGAEERAKGPKWIPTLSTQSHQMLLW